MSPQRKGMGQRPKKFPPENVHLMVTLLSIDERGSTYTMKEVQKVFETHLNQKWALNMLTTHLRILLPEGNI
jgi:hypothetical protein